MKISFSNFFNRAHAYIQPDPNWRGEPHYYAFIDGCKCKVSWMNRWKNIETDRIFSLRYDPSHHIVDLFLSHGGSMQLGIAREMDFTLTQRIVVDLSK